MRARALVVVVLLCPTALSAPGNPQCGWPCRCRLPPRIATRSRSCRSIAAVSCSTSCGRSSRRVSPKATCGQRDKLRKPLLHAADPAKPSAAARRLDLAGDSPAASGSGRSDHRRHPLRSQHRPPLPRARRPRRRDAGVARTRARHACGICLRHAGAFAVFGPSVRVQAGRIVVPGGADASRCGRQSSAPIRQSPRHSSGGCSATTRASWRGSTTRWSQLDEPRLRFATSASLADTGAHRTSARAPRRLRARRRRVAAGKAAVHPSAARSGVDAGDGSRERGRQPGRARTSAGSGSGCSPMNQAGDRRRSRAIPTRSMPLDAVWLVVAHPSRAS